jgi:hypothetical protein
MGSLSSCGWPKHTHSDMATLRAYLAQLLFHTKWPLSAFLLHKEISQSFFLELIGLNCSFVISWRMFHHEYYDYPFLCLASLLVRSSTALGHECTEET